MSKVDENDEAQVDVARRAAYAAEVALTSGRCMPFDDLAQPFRDYYKRVGTYVLKALREHLERQP